MKLAYIVENYGVMSETFVADLIDGIAQRGLQVRVFENAQMAGCHPPRGNFEVIQTGFTSRYNGLIVWLGRAGRILFNAHHLSSRLRGRVSHHALLQPLKSFSPDVAYIDHGNNAVLVRSALKALEIPYVVHFHGRDASHLFGSKVYAEQLEDVFADSAGMIVASGHIRRRLILAGCPDEKIHLIPLGVQVDKIPEPDWASRRSIKPSVVHLGRLVEKKNPLALLHAFSIVKSQVPEATLTIIGDGPLRAPVERRIRELGLTDSVSLTGALPNDRALAELARHSLYAQHCVTDSSGDQEGFNISFLEAAASGLPVVSTLHDGIPENVVHGETGFLVPEYDYESMAERMVQLLRDPARMEAMGRAGRDRVASKFQFAHRADRIVSLLRRLS